MAHDYYSQSAIAIARREVTGSNRAQEPRGFSTRLAMLAGFNMTQKSFGPRLVST
jgi:hypothetical protein